MRRWAKMSRDGRYRFALRRTWDATKPAVLFVGLNPSIADGHIDDPTTRRCIRFAREWGYGTLYVGNLFGLVSSSPSQLKTASDPIGRNNDQWLRRLSRRAKKTVVAWGNRGRFQHRSTSVRAFLGDTDCLGCTKLGEPRHPLYVRADTDPRRCRITRR